MKDVERVGRAAYAHPGSARLGELVGEQAARANLLLLENHGLLAYDTSVKEALLGLRPYEMTVRMYITVRSAGVELRGLPGGVVRDFLANSGYRPPREWPA